MTLRTIGSFAVAIFLGLIAVFLLRGLVSSPKPGAASDPAAATATVVVAALPVERGVSLTQPMLKVVNYPKDAVPAGAFQSVDQLVGKTAPVRTTVRSLASNEPVLPSKVSGPGSKANLSAAITPGMRAVSLRSSDVTAVGGFVLPGDRVDVLMTRSTGSGDAAGTVTQVLAENALVLGVDQISDQDADKPVVAKAVTVEVTPDQAQAISLAGAIGQVSLDLRQIADHAPLTRRLTSVADFGGSHGATPGGQKHVQARRSRFMPQLTEVRVVRGVETTTYSVGGF